MEAGFVSPENGEKAEEARGRMEERVRAFIREHRMIEAGDRIVAGISGGPDSVCLLFLLEAVCREQGASLHAVHVNHGLRGREADEDEAFVQDLCKKLAVPFSSRSFDVRERARRERISLEEAGRLCRYEAFFREADGLGGAKVAVGHHANDQAETVLFHLFRGTGIRGLSGMEPVKGNIIRPLLCVEREEILDWLKERGISWRTDRSNESLDYTRNRIRNELLPCAGRAVNLQAVRHTAEAAEELWETERYLSGQAEKAYEQCVLEKEQKLYLSASSFAKTDPVIGSRVLRLCLERLGGLRDVERIHIRLLFELLEKQTGSRLDLPGNRQAVRDYRGICFQKKKQDGEAEGGKEREAAESFLAAVPGSVEIDGRVWRFSLEKAQKDQIIPQKTYTKWFDYDKIKKCLVIRRRRPGDYLEINKEHGRKKLKAYLVDEKIPASEREQLWLLADEEHILWIPGHRISEGYKVTAKTERILKVQVDGGKKIG